MRKTHANLSDVTSQSHRSDLLRSCLSPRSQCQFGVYRGPFILVPVSVAALPAGVERADPDPFARLIERYIEPDGNPRRVEEARLRDYGYAVWALLGDILVPGRTADLIAHEYHVPVQAVEAVWAYYLRNRTALDRRLAENRAA